MLKTTGLLLKDRFKKTGKALLLTVPFFLIYAGLMSQALDQRNDLQTISTYLSILFMVSVFFLMMYTGKTYRYRRIFFVALAFCFVFSFITTLIQYRGSIILKADNFLKGETPFCHLVIPSTIIPAILDRTILFPGSMLTGFAAIGFMLIIWLGASLVLGRGWCSWICFYGGMDEGCSAVGKKPILKRLPKALPFLPYAVLAFSVIVSILTLSPAYCGWICPFRAVTEFEEVASFTVLIQTVIFVSLFIIFMLVLPFLTKKRSQCSFLCPFAAFQQLANGLSIFTIRIDRVRCVDCGKCIRECPTYSLTEKSLKKGKTLLNCSRCGKCIDVCPQKAISFHIRGTRPKRGSLVARNIFIYSAFLFAAIFGGGYFHDTIYKLMSIVTSGNLFV
jgi:ferredoxin-type protein NapH